MRRILPLFLYLNFFIIQQTFAQCPVMNFTAPDSACIRENINVTNNSVNADSVSWDFCSGDLFNTPVSGLSTSLSGMSNARNFTLIHTLSGWYGFTVSITDNNLFRLYFGNDPASVPTVENLGNINNKFNRPIPVVITEYGGNWYAFVFNGGTSAITRLDFGNDPGNMPATTDVIDSVGGDFTNMDIGLDSGNYNLVLSNYGTSNFSMVRLGNSPLNIPQPSDVISTPSVSGANFLDVRIYKDCGTWFGFAAGYNNKKIYRLGFTNGLAHLPVITELAGYDFGSDLPTRISVEQELGKYVCLVTAESGNLYRGVIGYDIQQDTLETFVNTGNVTGGSSTYGFSMARSGSRRYAFEMAANGNLYQSVFPDHCSASTSSSSSIQPSGLYYDSAGAYYLACYGFNASNNSSVRYDTLIIKNSSAPPVSFYTQNSCLSNPNAFIASSSGDSVITSWVWDFGDGSPQAAGQSVNHTYSSAGTYLVALSITTSQGCSNSLGDSISIFIPPVASFNSPVSNLCTNSELPFSNTSTGINNDSVKFSWNYNGEGSSGERDGKFTFLTTGSKTVTLVTNLTGCIDSVQHSISVSTGPYASFTWKNNCWDASINESTPSFINLSDSAMTGDSWNFGDGSPFSNLSDPDHSFPTTGNYPVSLTVTDTVSGCHTIKTDTLVISSAPLALFTGDSVLTENIPVHFYGISLTSSQDSIVSWHWNFDSLGTSVSKDPVFTFGKPGSYKITLTVSSTQGCVFDTSRTVNVSAAVCPSVSVSIPRTACMNENIQIVNNSINTDSVLWDFCSGDLFNNPSGSFLTTLTGLDNARNFITVHTATGWYGFSMNITDNSLFRLSFGNDLTSVPVFDNMGNIGGMFSRPIPVVLIPYQGNWYTFVHNGFLSNIVRLDFGNDLNTTPTATEVIGSVGGDFTNMDYGLDSGNYFLLLSNYSAGNFTIVKLGNSPANIPQPFDTVVTSSIPGAGLLDVKLFRECNTWHAFAVGYNSRKIYRLDFNNGLAHVPVITELTGYDFGLDLPARISIEQELGKYVCFVTSESGYIYRGVIGNFITNDSLESFVNLGNFSNQNSSFGFSLAHDGSRWYGFQLTSSGSLFRADFPDNCSAGYPLSFEFTPTNISYAAPGTYFISCYAYGRNQNLKVTGDTVMISGMVSPLISFITSNACLSQPNLFNATSSFDSLVSSWIWNFGDGSPADTGQTVNHQYDSAAIYPVTLSIQSQNGCANFSSRQVPVFPPPVPEFSISPSLLCSHNLISFQNTSVVLAPDSLVSYQWSLNGEATAASQDTSYLFTSGGDKNISFQISIPGCAADTTRIISVLEGPSAGFDFNNECDQVPVNFTNSSSGDYNQTSWNFGDGNNSFLNDPTHTYNSPGRYAAMLTVTDSLGCQNSREDTLTIYNYPVPGFQHDLPCTGTNVMFYDTSRVAGANINGYQWTISNSEAPDSNQISFDKNPAFIISSPGNYRISLRVTSNFNCADSISAPVQFLQSPKAGFSYDPGCVDDTTYFHDLSSAMDTFSITSWTWNINGQVMTTPDIAYRFTSSGNYPVSLLVRSDNRCTTQAKKTLILNPLPVAGFISFNQCLNQTTILRDHSYSVPDSINRFFWIINSADSFSGPDVTIEFRSPGKYAVLHQVTTQGNCSSQFQDTVVIHNFPQAEFSFTPSFGAPPLQVSFKNESTGAVSYSWDFGEIPVFSSAEENPEHTFTLEGNYKILLAARNEFGCLDSAFKELIIARPDLDVAIKNVTTFESNGSRRFILDIANPGTVIVDTMDILININNDYNLTEPFIYPLYAEDTVNHLLDFELAGKPGQGPDYICFELQPHVAGYEETSLVNNIACYTPGEKFAMIDPYPNPVNDDLTVAFIQPRPSAVEIQLVSAGGAIVQDQYIKNTSAGYNEFHLSLEKYDPGMYMLRLASPDFKITRKIFVIR